MPSTPLELFSIDAPMPARWFPGDQIPRSAVRTLLKPFRDRPPAGLGKVVENLVLGLQNLGIEHHLHRHPVRVKTDRAVGILNGPIDRCREIAARNKCIIGPGVMTTPADWPDVFDNTRTTALVQACEWSAEMYRSVFGNRVRVWPTGIDTYTHVPRDDDPKTHDFLIYDKIRWPDTPYVGMVERAKAAFAERGLSFHYIRYGQYGSIDRFYRLLRDSRAMLFLCEHETQGIAYNEALSLGVPILAANFGIWSDPNQACADYGAIQVTSIPYWDERCGTEFRTPGDFTAGLDEFCDALAANRFAPRDYILENLTLEQCARDYVRLCDEA